MSQETGRDGKGRFKIQRLNSQETEHYRTSWQGLDLADEATSEVVNSISEALSNEDLAQRNNPFDVVVLEKISESLRGSIKRAEAKSVSETQESEEEFNTARNRKDRSHSLFDAYSPIPEEDEKSSSRKVSWATGSKLVGSIDITPRGQESTSYLGKIVEKLTTMSEENKNHLEPENGGHVLTDVKASTRRLSLFNKNAGRRKSSIFLRDRDDPESTIGVYGKSLQHYTQDALPRMDNYRNLMSISAAQRPTMDELLEENVRHRKPKHQEMLEQPHTPASEKFGWIKGVLARCLLNIWGVMLFLRLSWMVAHAGIIHTMIIITISTVVTTITALSMSAVSTNGEMKGGGIYYMLSRTMGPAWGGSLGAVFSFANSGMAALNTVGFSETVVALMKTFDVTITGDVINDNRVISVITVIVLQGIIVVGKEYEAKCQMGLLVVLLIAMVDYVVGAFMGPQSVEQQAKGFVGMSAQVFTENLWPGYKFSEGQEQDFFTIFAIFFPAVAGIQAGASISGDLKDPASAIPKGTLLAIFITSASYAFFACLAGAGELRDATGNVSEVINGTYVFKNCTGGKCDWGLYNDFQVMNLMAAFGPLIYAGCFAATLSSALSCLVSGSEMFQALGKDEIYPKTKCFGKGYGKKQDPYWSYLLGFIIALIFILIGDLNAIAPLISNMFMVTYALLNFVVFYAGVLKPVGWRPTFKYCNRWVSLAGAFMCIAVMFLMQWQSGLVAMACAIILFLVVAFRDPIVDWGATTEAQIYHMAVTSVQRIQDLPEHAKNYHPQLLVLSGYVGSRPALVEFAHLLTKKTSLMILANVSKVKQPTRLRRAILENGYDWLEEREMKAYYVMVDDCTLNQGSKCLMQTVGLGKLTPNILLMGYKGNWESCDLEEVKEYFHVLHEAFDNHMAIAILRVKGGFDIATGGGIDVVMTENELKRASSYSSMEGYDNHVSADPTDPEAINEIPSPRAPAPVVESAQKKGHKLIFGGKKNDKGDDGVMGVYRGPDGSEIPKDFLGNVSIFSGKQKKGTIDVWWLYDDGGLTLLLPYILAQRRDWQNCKLRVFALANKQSEMEVEHRRMASLLSKFRIDYSALTVIPDITKRADKATKAFFEGLIKGFKGDPDESGNPEMTIGDSELVGQKEKTNRHLRLRELLLEHSKDANMIVMTLPIPRRGNVSPPLYMAWLECLTRDMPPFLLVRGNQTSVLTFYS